MEKDQASTTPNSTMDRDALRQSLEELREELHELNLDKMRRESPANEDTNVANRTYSISMGYEAGRKALENCKMISKLVRQENGSVANELDENIKRAEVSLNGNRDSKEGIDQWYRSELVPLINKSEQLLETS